MGTSLALGTEPGWAGVTERALQMSYGWGQRVLVTQREREPCTPHGCALCTDFTCLRTPWWPLLVLRRTHSAPRPGGIQTNFGHAAVVTVRKGTFPQGQVSPTFTYMCSEHMAHASLVKFRAAETRCIQKCLIGAVGRHFWLNGEKDWGNI